MSLNRPFAYNTGTTINGTEQYGLLSVGINQQTYASDIGGVKWWMGPDEELGFVIAKPVHDFEQPNPLGGQAGVAFSRTNDFSDESFIRLFNKLNLTNDVINDANDIREWLLNNGYWTSYVVPLPNNSLFDVRLIYSWDDSSNWSIENVEGNDYFNNNPYTLNGESGPNMDYMLHTFYLKADDGYEWKDNGRLTFEVNNLVTIPNGTKQNNISIEKTLNDDGRIELKFKVYGVISEVEYNIIIRGDSDLIDDLEPSVTPTNTPSVTPTNTPSVTPSNTPSVTPTNTPSVTPTNTPSVTTSPDSVNTIFIHIPN